MFIYISFFVSALLIQNASSNFIGKRNIEGSIAAEAIINPSLLFPEMDMPPFVEPTSDWPPMYVPEPSYFPMSYPDIPSPPYTPAPVWPNYEIPAPDFGDVGVEAVIVEEPVIVEAPCVTEVPLISTVGFGNDAVCLALSPLMETADADVALLMYNKVRVI